MSGEAEPITRDIYELGPKMSSFISSYFQNANDVIPVDLEVTIKSFEEVKKVTISKWRHYHITSIKMVENEGVLRVIGLDNNGIELQIFERDTLGDEVGPAFIYDNNLRNEKYRLDARHIKGIQFAPTKDSFIDRVFNPSTGFYRGIAEFKARFFFKDMKGKTFYIDTKNVTLEDDQVYGIDHGNKKHKIYSDETSPYGISENHGNSSFQDIILTAISRVLRKSSLLNKFKRK